ncbi:MAG: translation initiation factor IF-2 [Elusimicrobia bacterium]|nr:translation initiation factor IF-2 [Elusimicrobiota bacterium]
MTEKKKSVKAVTKSDEGEGAKTEKKAVKARKPAASGTTRAKKAEARPAVHKQAAEKRETQEEGSIAPPSGNLVSAFSLLRKTNRPAAQSPTIARIAPGGSLPKPPAPPPPPAPAAPASAAPQASAAKPLPQAGPKPGVPGVVPPGALKGSPSGARPPVADVRLPLPLPPGVKTPLPPGVRPPLPPASTAPRASGVPPAPPPPVRPGGAPPRPGGPAGAPPRPGGPGHFRPGQRPGQGPGRPGGVRPPHGQARPAGRPAEAPAAKPGAPKPALKRLQVSTMVTVRELAEKMVVKPNEVIAKLMNLGIFATINQRLEGEAASIVAQEFGWELDVVAMYKEEELAVASIKEPPEKLKPRPPVVTVMGHVDHGKTSLLDAIKSSNVAAGESGQITQHIGAYRVPTTKGDVVFLDTPGHAAFTAMRARGAKVTDLVILVVSAVDGVQPQTVEAIDHAKAAGVPIIVAVNKIDLPGANPQKIRQELSGHGLLSEEWGGKTIFVEVSAKKRINIDGLLEMIGIQSMMMELKANPDRPAHGVILESRLDARKGSIATVLIQAGTLKVGDPFVAGLAHGKVKALHDDHGKRIISAGPAIPAEVLGCIGTPQAGDVFSVVANERQSREIAERRGIVAREQAIAHQRHVTLVGLKSQVKARAVKELNIVLKVDVAGSLQAIKDSLETLSNPECRVRTIHGGLGNVTESDVLLASASDAVIMAFHADVEPRAEELAGREGVEVRKYEIIYEIIADVKAALEGLLEPEIVDVVVGKAEVLQVFSVKDGGRVAGSIIREGKVTRGCVGRLLRGGAVIHKGKVSSLRRFKDDAKEVEKGMECGLALDGAPAYMKGDLLEFVVTETRTRRLSDAAEKK